MAFRQLSALARSQGAYDRFSAATDLPLTFLAVLWLPVLVLPLASHSSSISLSRSARSSSRGPRISTLLPVTRAWPGRGETPSASGRAR